MNDDIDKQQFESAIRDLRFKAKRLFLASTSAQVYEYLADAAYRMRYSQPDGFSTDARDIAGLTYLAARHALKGTYFPDKAVKTELDGLVNVIRKYVTANYEETLIHAQNLAQTIANPHARGGGGRPR